MEPVPEEDSCPESGSSAGEANGACRGGSLSLPAKHGSHSDTGCSTQAYASVIAILLIVIVVSVLDAILVLGKSHTSTAGAPLKLIIDTDIGGGGCKDVDDVLAVAVGNALADNGECELIAVILNTAPAQCAGAISAINHFYGRDEVPIGAYNISTRGATLVEEEPLPYVNTLVEQFDPPVKSSAQAEDSVQLYRRLLAAQPDSSVIISSIGILTNLAALLKSPPDVHSPLHGTALIAQKVHMLAVMGGKYPSGQECNLCGGDSNQHNHFVASAASSHVAKHWPKASRILWSGFNVGSHVLTGGAGFQRFQSTTILNPVRVAMVSFEKGPNIDDASWDPVTTLAAIRGAAAVGCSESTITGRNVINASNGNNTWVAGPDANQSYLLLHTPKVAEDAINVLLRQLPATLRNRAHGNSSSSKSNAGNELEAPPLYVVVAVQFVSLFANVLNHRVTRVMFDGDAIEVSLANSLISITMVLTICGGLEMAFDITGSTHGEFQGPVIATALIFLHPIMLLNGFAETGYTCGTSAIYKTSLGIVLKVLASFVASMCTKLMLPVFGLDASSIPNSLYFAAVLFAIPGVYFSLTERDFCAACGKASAENEDGYVSFNLSDDLMLDEKSTENQVHSMAGESPPQQIVVSRVGQPKNSTQGNIGGLPRGRASSFAFGVHGRFQLTNSANHRSSFAVAVSDRHHNMRHRLAGGASFAFGANRREQSKSELDLMVVQMLKRKDAQKSGRRASEAEETDEGTPSKTAHTVYVSFVSGVGFFVLMLSNSCWTLFQVIFAKKFGITSIGYITLDQVYGSLFTVLITGLSTCLPLTGTLSSNRSMCELMRTVLEKTFGSMCTSPAAFTYLMLSKLISNGMIVVYFLMSTTYDPGLVLLEMALMKVTIGVLYTVFVAFVCPRFIAMSKEEIAHVTSLPFILKRLLGLVLITGGLIVLMFWRKN